MDSKNVVCQNCKADFTIEPDDFGFYEKIKVPPPTWCPECRLIRRLAWRSERALHKRVCESCDKSTISVYSEQSPVKLYCNDCWWGDSWHGEESGVDFDESRPFLAQIFDLMHKVPAVSLFGSYSSLVNSEYTNAVSYLKNCYLITHSDYCEDCVYGSNVTNSKDCVDTYLIDKCENSYELTNCRNCYGSLYSLDCDSCYNILFCRNCTGCNDCFGCANLVNKKYHIFNEPHTQEEYEKKLKEIYPTTDEKLKSALEKSGELWLKYPQKFMHGIKNTGVTGDYIFNSKNVKNSYISAKLEDSKFCMLITPGPGKAANLYDFTHFGINSELLYESLQLGNSARVKFSWWAIPSQDVEYSMWCPDNKNIFGCVGLKKKEYCILNKQYSPKDFFVLRERIIKHMNDMPYIDAKGRVYKYGEFFPIEASPFGYNETAHIYFPLSKKEILARGYVWRDPDERKYEIDNVTTFACEHKGECMHNCALAFRFIPYELEFYKKYNLPQPRLCFNCRHAARVALTNPPKLWNRGCMCDKKNHFHGEGKCVVEFETSYAPERPEIVYCEKCYQQEVY